MTTKPRWLAAIAANAAASKTRMPWERGLRRAAAIRRRRTTVPTGPRRAAG
ncbi:hypothetical protein [Wenxinia saemankumensis]|uniref:Uncharacterized protein n=1 Tax=Wenxinia saemankumensis TaxID=1447782 RepID=A0A1M6BXN8_9RHOB|nr:hypothetical protein [Wenxinia saemankumensis]SHI53248.1 hypothetical protein SAMN05444417_0891 [Wenxinia saemankumensis]